MALNTDLLETSFALLRDRKSEFTQTFYTTLFQNYPQVQPLFTNTHLDQQAEKLFASLVLVVENLKKPEALTNALTGLGTRHIKYGVLPEHYPMVGATLLQVMSTTLQSEWTDEIAAAWTNAYGAITEIMLEGTDYPEETLHPTSAIATA